MKQRKFTPQQKAAVALAALKGDKTFAQISSMYHVHQTQIRKWKKIAETNFATLFTEPHRKVHDEQVQLIDELYRIIGKRDTQLSWLKKKLHIIDESD
jgi:transposase